MVKIFKILLWLILIYVIAFLVSMVNVKLVDGNIYQTVKIKFVLNRKLSDFVKEEKITYTNFSQITKEIYLANESNLYIFDLKKNEVKYSIDISSLSTPIVSINPINQEYASLVVLDKSNRVYVFWQGVKKIPLDNYVELENEIDIKFVQNYLCNNRTYELIFYLEDGEKLYITQKNYKNSNRISLEVNSDPDTSMIEELEISNYEINNSYKTIIELNKKNDNIYRTSTSFKGVNRIDKIVYIGDNTLFRHCRALYLVSNLIKRNTALVATALSNKQFYSGYIEDSNFGKLSRSITKITSFILFIPIAPFMGRQ